MLHEGGVEFEGEERLRQVAEELLQKSCDVVYVRLRHSSTIKYLKEKKKTKVTRNIVLFFTI